MEGFITTREAAEILGVSITSISRLINRGVLKGERFGPVWMVERASVEDYRERNADKQKNDPTRGKATKEAEINS